MYLVIRNSFSVVPFDIKINRTKGQIRKNGNNKISFSVLFKGGFKCIIHQNCIKHTKKFCRIYINLYRSKQKAECLAVYSWEILKVKFQLCYGYFTWIKFSFIIDCLFIMFLLILFNGKGLSQFSRFDARWYIIYCYTWFPFMMMLVWIIILIQKPCSSKPSNCLNVRKKFTEKNGTKVHAH